MNTYTYTYIESYAWLYAYVHMHTCTLIPDIYTSMYGLCKYMHAGTTVIHVCLSLCTAIAVVYTSSFFDVWNNSYLINDIYIYMYIPDTFLMPCWYPLDALLMPYICLYVYGRMLLSPSDALLSFSWPSNALQTPFWCYQMPFRCTPDALQVHSFLSYSPLLLSSSYASRMRLFPLMLSPCNASSLRFFLWCFLTFISFVFVPSSTLCGRSCFASEPGLYYWSCGPVGLLPSLSVPPILSF
jgi:hypothetical protein